MSYTISEAKKLAKKFTIPCLVDYDALLKQCPLRCHDRPRTRQCKLKKSTREKSSKPPKEGKPGTAGSRQAINPPKRVRRNQINDTDSDETIQTDYIVDRNIIYSYTEMKQRFRSRDAPSDPKKWCKDFHFIIPFLDLRVEPEPVRPEKGEVFTRSVGTGPNSPQDQ